MELDGPPTGREPSFGWSRVSAVSVSPTSIVVAAPTLRSCTSPPTAQPCVHCTSQSAPASTNPSSEYENNYVLLFHCLMCQCFSSTMSRHPCHITSYWNDVWSFLCRNISASHDAAHLHYGAGNCIAACWLEPRDSPLCVVCTCSVLSCSIPRLENLVFSHLHLSS